MTTPQKPESQVLSAPSRHYCIRCHTNPVPLAGLVCGNCGASVVESGQLGSASSEVPSAEQLPGDFLCDHPDYEKWQRRDKSAIQTLDGIIFDWQTVVRLMDEYSKRVAAQAVEAAMAQLKRVAGHYEETASCGHPLRYLIPPAPHASGLICSACQVEKLAEENERLKVELKKKKVCGHSRLNEEGYCRLCGEDCRGIH